MPDLWNVPLNETRCLSIRQFCLAEDISEEALYGLAAQGRAPKLLRRHGDLFWVDVITPEARRDWHKYMIEGFPDAHREIVEEQYFPTGSAEWREERVHPDLETDEDWCHSEEDETPTEEEWLSATLGGTFADAEQPAAA